MSSFCIKSFQNVYYLESSIDLVHIWHESKYGSKVYLSLPSPQPVTLKLMLQT